jgi:hypothetical protein
VRELHHSFPSKNGRTSPGGARQHAAGGRQVQVFVAQTLSAIAYGVGAVPHRLAKSRRTHGVAAPDDVGSSTHATACLVGLLAAIRCRHRASAPCAGSPCRPWMLLLPAAPGRAHDGRPRRPPFHPPPPTARPPAMAHRSALISPRNSRPSPTGTAAPRRRMRPSPIGCSAPCRSRSTSGSCSNSDPSVFRSSWLSSSPMSRSRTSTSRARGSVR